MPKTYKIEEVFIKKPKDAGRLWGVHIKYDNDKIGKYEGCPSYQCARQCAAFAKSKTDCYKLVSDYGGEQWVGVSFR